MTRITRKLIRETPASIRDAGQSRPIVVLLCCDGLWLRQKGRRRLYHLPFEAAWSCAARLAALQALRERRAQPGRGRR